MSRALRHVVSASLLATVACLGRPSPRPPAPQPGPVRVASVYAPHRIDPDRNPQLTAMTVTAASEVEAARRQAQASQAGPGRPLPPGVVVDAWLELDGRTRLRSSVSGRFAVFRLVVDGELVADLSAGLNVAAEAPGHGWSTLVVGLPEGLLLPGTPLRLVQRREGASEQLTLRFGG